MNKPLSGVSNQILLYAKGWYGKSGNIIDDVRKVVSKYCSIEIEHVSKRDVLELLASTFAECVKNEYRVREAIIEIASRHEGDDFIIKRTNEQIIIGKISVVDGSFVNKDEMMPNFRVDLTPLNM